MTANLTVDEAKKVLKLAERVSSSAMKAPWETQEPEQGEVFIIGTDLGGAAAAALPWPTELDSGDFTRVQKNAAAIVLWRAAFGGLLEYLEQDMVGDKCVGHAAYAALTPLVAWADANHKGWRDAEPGNEDTSRDDILCRHLSRVALDLGDRAHETHLPWSNPMTESTPAIVPASDENEEAKRWLMMLARQTTRTTRERYLIGRLLGLADAAMGAEIVADADRERIAALEKKLSAANDECQQRANEMPKLAFTNTQLRAQLAEAQARVKELEDKIAAAADYDPKQASYDSTITLRTSKAMQACEGVLAEGRAILASRAEGSKG